MRNLIPIGPYDKLVSSVRIANKLLVFTERGRTFWVEPFTAEVTEIVRPSETDDQGDQDGERNSQ
jgi:hypothetical protein